MVDVNVLVVVGLFTIGVAFLWRHPSFRGSPFPGPKGYPIIGNILPQTEVWEALRQYAKVHGPIFSLRVLTVRMVVVNTFAPATELFVRRSGIYSDRVPWKMIRMCGMEGGALWESDLTRFRQSRRFIALGFASRELDAFRPRLRAGIVTFLGRLLHTPDQFLNHIRDLPIGLLLGLVYGYDAKGDANDPYIVGAETLVHNYARVSSLSLDEGYIVNWLPFRAGFKNVAAAYRKQADDFYKDTYNLVVKDMAGGIAQKSMVSTVLQDSPDSYNFETLARTAAQMVTGGADTTVSAMSTFMLSMVLHPEVQKKAQAELDRVVGSERLPVYADRPNLPYIDAIMREVLRWHTPVPTVVRDMAKDDIYDGKFIPKGTLFLINFWAMLYNEDAFPEPSKFKPERWLDRDITKDIDPIETAFGFGRRECPGKQFALEMFFTVIAGVLASFDILKAKNENGEDITPPEKYSDGSITSPLPFVCNIKPRSESYRQLLEGSLQTL